MNKKNFALIMLLAGGMTVVACGPTEQKANESSTELLASVDSVHAYICPMRCENSGSDSPGQCPVCGMDLVKNPDYKGRNDSATDTASSGSKAPPDTGTATGTNTQATTGY